MADRVRLSGLVLGEVLVVVGLHALARLDAFRIPRSDFGAWLERSPFEDVLGAVLLLVALALAYWLLVSTLAYCIASASGRPRLIRVVDWLTLPPIRRLASRAVALSLAASTVAGPLAPAVANLGGSGGGQRVIVDPGLEGQMSPPGTADRAEGGGDESLFLPPHLGPAASRPPSAARPAEGRRADPPSLDGSMPHTVQVRRGDHMWSLSEAHLRQITSRHDLGEHELARYWVRVIEANRTRIRSGNPDLIYPGETLVLPPVEQ